VLKPPSNVGFKNQNDPTLVLTYPGDKDKQVECFAEGGRPAATFSWMLGDKKLTSQLSDIESTVAEDGTSSQSQILTYTTKPEDNGKTLTCVVEHPGYDLDTKDNTAVLKLDVMFPPIANDDVLEYYGHEVGNSETVRINFKSHPAPTEVLWEMHDGTKIPQESESLDQRFKADAVVPGPSDGLFTAQLTISKFTNEDTDAENKLVVTNSEGTTAYKFILGLGEKPPAAPTVSDTEGVPSPKDAGQYPIVAVVIVAFLIIIVIVAAVIAKSRGMLCFADKNMGDDGEKSAAQFEALEKGEASPEKEPIKDQSNDIKQETETPVVNENVPIKESVDESEEKQSNGAHTPV